MTYAQFITKIRQSVRDLPRLTQDKWDGDASTLAFQSSERPVLEGEYQVYVGGAQQTETTNYTLDKDTGLLEMVSAPGAGTKNVRMDYKFAFLRDNDYLEIINEVLSEWRRKLWTSAFDETLSTTADIDDYDLSSLISGGSNIIWVVNGWVKKSADTEWYSIGTDRNWTFFPEQGILNIKPTFSTSDYTIRLQLIKAYTLGTLTSSTFQPDAKFHPAILTACQAKYWMRMASYKMRDTEAVSKEATYEPGASLMRMALQLQQLSEKQLARVKPRYPSGTVRNIIQGLTS